MNQIMYKKEPELPKAETVFITVHDYQAALKVLARALTILATRWTNKGYKVKQEEGGPKCCILGSIDIAKEQLGMSKYIHNSRLDLPTLFINDTALLNFNCSAVTVNDELGYYKVVKLFGMTIERMLIHAATTRSDVRGIEYRTTGSPS